MSRRFHFNFLARRQFTPHRPSLQHLSKALDAKAISAFAAKSQKAGVPPLVVELLVPRPSSAAVESAVLLTWLSIPASAHGIDANEPGFLLGKE
jgi:hypothetical protein